MNYCRTVALQKVMFVCTIFYTLIYTHCREKWLEQEEKVLSIREKINDKMHPQCTSVITRWQLKSVSSARQTPLRLGRANSTFA